MKIIGLLGRAGSGKDETAKILQDYFETNKHKKCTLYSFAGELKSMLSDMLGIPLDYFNNHSLKETIIPGFEPHTPRSLMVWFGTIMKEKFGNLFWINHVKKKIVKELETNTCEIIIITDVRFISEVEFIYSLNGFIFHIIRDVLPDLDLNTAHESEKAVLSSAMFAKKTNPTQFMQILNNSFGLDKLKHTVRGAILNINI